MITAAQLETSLAILRRLREPACASIILAMTSDEQDAYVRLARMGYVGELDRERVPSKLTVPFRWSRVQATPAGLEYLRQIETTREVLRKK